MIHVSSKHTALVDYEMLQKKQRIGKKELSHLKKRLSHTKQYKTVQGKIGGVRQDLQEVYKNPKHPDYNQRKSRLEEKLKELDEKSKALTAKEKNDSSIYASTFRNVDEGFLTRSQQSYFDRHKQLTNYTS